LAAAKWAGRGAGFVAGTIPSIAFPEPSLSPLAFVGLVPLLLIVRTAPDLREAAVRSWLGGTGFLFATHLWLTPKVGPFLVLVCLVVGGLWAPWGAACWSLLRDRLNLARALAATAVLPAVWIAIEVVRSLEHLGGPFGLLGASQWNAPPMLSLAAVGGVWAVSFVIVAVNVALTAGIAAYPNARVSLPALAIACIAILLGPLYHSLRAQPSVTDIAHVGVVQVGPTEGADQRFAAGIRNSQTLVGKELDLVVWGESSVGFDLARRPDLQSPLRRLAADLNARVLVNVDARRSGAGGIYKSSMLMSSMGEVATYDKMRLVPFGEYIPARPVLGWVTRFTEAATEDRRRGDGVRLMRAGDIAFTPLVCFESAFPDLARSVTAAGSDLIVYQSAITTFQHSWGPEIHASLAAVRAVETGRPVVHASLTGVTAAFDARGGRIGWMSSSDHGARVLEMPLTTGTTAFVRLGNWVPVASIGILAIYGAVLVRRRRNRRLL
jgi:apolipoprotein N-acyltransferase